MKKKYTPILALVVFLLFLVFMQTGGRFIQGQLGIYGAAVTELIIAGLAVGAAILQKEDLKDFFPLTPPSPRVFFGSALIFGGAWCVMIGLTALFSFLFPNLTESAAGLSGMIRSVSPVVSILIVALLPAICEELLFRGYIQSSLRPIGKKWLVIVAVGVLFGIAHMDPLRFIPTSILGMVFAYLAFETGSIFLGMLFHFINNLLSVVSTFLSSDSLEGTLEQAFSIPLSAIVGSCLTYFAVGAILAFLGWHLLKQKKLEPKPFMFVCGISGTLFVFGITLAALETAGSVLTAIAVAMLYASFLIAGCFILLIILTRKKPKISSIIVTCVTAFLLFVGSIALILFTMPDPVYSSTKQLIDPAETVSETVQVEESGMYQITVVGMCSNCTAKWTMRGETDSVVAYEGDMLSHTDIFTLEKGEYQLTYSIKKGEEDKECNAQIRVQINLLTSVSLPASQEN